MARRVADHVLDDMVGFLTGDEDEPGKIAAPDLERWQKDPVAWAVERMGIPEGTIRWSANPGYEDHRWDGTKDPLCAIAEALASGKWVAAESGTGTGKTFQAAWLGFWLLDTRPGVSKVISVAPKEKQLKKGMWAEMRKMMPTFRGFRPEAKMITLELKMDSSDPTLDKWEAVGLSCGVGADEESATKMQGHHEKWMLFIIEEGPGVHPAIYTAIENTCSNPEQNLVLAIGNPDHMLDGLHLFSSKPGTTHVRISGYDHPNVVLDDHTYIEGAITRTFIRKKAKQPGGMQARLYRSRVRGICPSQSADALIRWEDCVRAAQDNTIKFEDGPAAMGVDVANSEDGDLAGIAHGRGNKLIGVRTLPCPDANVLGGIVGLEMTTSGIVPDYVGVDSIGVGAGTYNELKRLGHHCQALNGSASPIIVAKLEERFWNLRAQMWWQMRLDLAAGRVILPDDEELFQDLTTPTWKPSGGKILVQPKEELRKLLKRSPDKGDATVYWNWVRERRTGSSKGGGLVTF